MKQTCLLLLFMLSMSLTAFAGEYNILDYGAIPDGQTITTSNIQNTIDATTMVEVA